MKPEIIDLPYPSIDEITPDMRSAKIISPAYSDSHSELTAIMQYVYHSIQFGNQGLEDIGSLLEDISIAEMHHFDILGNMLYKLGVDPIFSAQPPIRNNFFSTSYVNYSSTPEKMLSEDLAGEKKAIAMYEKMLGELNNPQVAAVIARIIKDEQLHVELLTQALESIPKTQRLFTIRR